MHHYEYLGTVWGMALLICFILYCSFEKWILATNILLIIFIILSIGSYRLITNWEDEGVLNDAHPVRYSAIVGAILSSISSFKFLLDQFLRSEGFSTYPVISITIIVITFTCMVDADNTRKITRFINNYHVNYHNLTYRRFPRHYNKKQINSAVEMRIHQLLTDYNSANSSSDNDVNPMIDCIARKFINYRLKMMEMKGHS